MELLFTILLLNILQQFVPPFAKLVAKILNGVRYRNTKVKNLRDELDKLQMEQKDISMMDEFAKYAKLQRKIDKLSSELKNLVDKRSQSYKMTKFILHYSLQAIFTVFLVAICVFHRTDSVIVLPAKWTLYFSEVYSFPVGAADTVSCFFWMLACRVGVNKMATYLKECLVVSGS